MLFEVSIKLASELCLVFGACKVDIAAPNTAISA